MGFRINTNIGAMNAHRNAIQTNIGLDNSLSKLSSGLRINKAADDASGMAIANSLRMQANGLGQSIVNANDAIGVTQTADGALEEYTKIIDTIRVKSIQAASDGQTLDTRGKIQSDIDRLMEEAQMIATSTSFNGQTLLNGAFQNKAFHIGAYSGEVVKLSIGDAQVAQVANFAISDGATALVARTAADVAVANSMTVTVTAADGAITTIVSAVNIATGAHTSAELAQTIADQFNADAQKQSANIRATVIEHPSSTVAVPAYTLRLDSPDTFTVTVDSTLPVGIPAGVVDLTNNFSTIDVTTRAAAEKSIIIADYAMRDIDGTRSDIGSAQQQLESTIRNISVTQVNVQAAESQIRDVDFAKESSNFAKLNILAQSGTYAMSQANSIQQNVMRLLQ